MAKLQSMEDLLNRKSLFVREIDTRAAKPEVKSDLEPVCPKDVGVVVVPVDPITQNGLGYAYCNFQSNADAREALRTYRFKLKVCGKPVSLAYSVSNKDRQKILGPWGYRLSIIVKNLSPDVTEKMLCEYFEMYGEIFRCKVGMAEYGASYGASYGLVQYIEERSVIKAVSQANRTVWLSSVLVVERHEKVLQPNGRTTTLREPSPTRLPATRPSTSSIQQPEARTIAEPVSRSLDRGFVPYLEPAGMGGSDPRASLAFDDIDHRSTAEDVQPLRPSPELRNRHGPYTGPSMVADKPKTSLSPETLVNGQNEFFAERNPSGDAAPGMYGVFRFMDDKRKSLCGGGYRPASAQPPMPPPMANGSTDPGVRRNAGSADRSMKDALEQLLRGAKAAERVVVEFEKLTGGQMGEGLLCCPITQEIFKDPVLASDGNTYERSAIKKWLFDNGRNTSPLTNEELPNMSLVPNKLVAKIVEALT